MPILQDVYADAIQRPGIKHLLTGNGFSRSLHPSNFDFKNLFERADFPPELLIFTKDDHGGHEGIGTYPDFEKTLKSFRDAELVLGYLRKPIPSELGNLADTMREGLIKAVHRVHEIKNSAGVRERYITRFSADEVLACANFLKTFRDRELIIFTLNYDLLIYRVLMEIKTPNSRLAEDGLPEDLVAANAQRLQGWGDGFVTRVDGFPVLQWEKWADAFSPRVCYLHGALHLFEVNDTAIKLVSDEENLLESIETMIQDGTMPLIVCEGTANRKRERVFGNDYLRDCHERLEGLSGELFVLGCSIAPNDDHIWSTLDKNSSLSQVNIGYFGAGERNNAEQAIARHFQKRTGNGTIAVFDSSLVTPWR